VANEKALFGTGENRADRALLVCSSLGALQGTFKGNRRGGGYEGHADGGVGMWTFEIQEMGCTRVLGSCGLGVDRRGGSIWVPEIGGWRYFG